MICLTKLYQHQRVAFDKLKGVRVGGLFMEMGTGKTRTALEFIAHRWDSISNVVWFCPVSLKDTLRREIDKHTDFRDYYIFGSSKRIPRDRRFYVVGIESISSSKRDTLTARALINEDSFVIVDESSFIKTHDALRTMRIIKMSEIARYRMLLTGTPITQGIQDLYAQMLFLSPKILGYNSFYSFAANHLEYSEKYPGMIVRAHKTDYVTRKINPYIYQVKKSECLDLPDKIYKYVSVPPTEDQLRTYTRVKDEILSMTAEWDSYTLFMLFTKLQQIASGFLNTDTVYPDGVLLRHRRVDLLQEVLESIPNDEKVVIWCKYQYSVETIAKRFNACYVYGKQTTMERKAQLDRFAISDKILVATMQTGGYGLNLQFCNYAIFYENSFNYAHRLQAEDRQHRIGQNKPVVYFDLSCQLRIEEYIRDNLSRKQNVISSFKRDLKQIQDKEELIELFKKEI